MYIEELTMTSLFHNSLKNVLESSNLFWNKCLVFGMIVIQNLFIDNPSLFEKKILLKYPAAKQLYALD